MLKKLLLPSLFALYPLIIHAQTLQLHPDAPAVYQVKRGDTLWDISGVYLEKPWRWPMLWQANPGIVNPHLIYPGDTLYLHWNQGKPTLSIQAAKSNTTVPISLFADKNLIPFLTFDTLINETDSKKLPRVLGNQGGWHYLSTDAPFFVDTELNGDDWFVYRPVKTFTRNNGAATSMISLRKVASATALRRADGMTEMQLTEQLLEVKPNDVLLPAKIEKTGEISTIKPASETLEGNMLGHIYGSQYVGLREIVVVDRGAVDGLAAGELLAVKQSSIGIKQQKGINHYHQDNDNSRPNLRLPAQSVGNLLVIRSFDFFSLAMVVDATQPLVMNMQVLRETADGRENADG